MITWKQRKAIRLMFQMTDDGVAREVGVKPETIARWRSDKEFCKALAAEGKNIRSAANRITAEASLLAAKSLHKNLIEGKDVKLSLDTLKASGAFEEKQENTEESLEDILKLAGESNESND